MSEFDDYAKRYEELLRDPIRDCFATGSDFFFERKWILLERLARRWGWQLGSMNWLDLGCGKGDLLRLGAPHMRETAGCDVSEAMLEACKGLNVVPQTDPSRLPFPDSKFDLVTAVCVYHHVPLPERPALTMEITRVLKPGGVACIVEHNPFNPATQWIVRRTPVDADAKLLTSRMARAVLSGAGLDPFHTAYFLYFPEKLYRRLGRMEDWLSGLPAGGQYASFARKTA